MKAGLPKKLWGNCLELESFICSHMTFNIFDVNDKVPQTVMSGETSDISQFCEHGWYDLVEFHLVIFPKIGPFCVGC